MGQTISLGHNIVQLSLIAIDSPYRASGYLIKEEKTILIETGASPSNAVIHSALAEQNIKPDQVDYIAVTHLHLDHAGGAGLLMSQCPNATLLIHKRGKAHMVDPTKLIAGARQVYGPEFEALFDPIMPVPEERIRIMEDGDRLNLGNGRELAFFDTPGHAFHHVVVHDPVSKGLFSGDSAGLYFKGLFNDYGISFCIPATAPTQFAPDIMNQTLSRLIELAPERIYFTHFGMAESAIDLLLQVKQYTTFFGDDCVKNYQKHRSPEKLVAFIQGKFRDDLKKLGINEEIPEMGTLKQDIELNVQGIVAYIEKMESK